VSATRQTRAPSFGDGGDIDSGNISGRGTTTAATSNTPKLLTADNFIRTVFGSVIGSTTKSVIATTTRPSIKYILSLLRYVRR
jgi:hypothetical protein